MQATASAPFVIKTTAPKIGKGTNRNGIKDNTKGHEYMVIKNTNIIVNNAKIQKYQKNENQNSLLSYITEINEKNTK